MKFWKMSGAGNDFVLVSGGAYGTSALKKLAVRLCARGISVGADGLLYVRSAGKGAVSVRYFNPDGSEAFCGNGSRCAAWWAFRRGLAGRRLVLRTLAGGLEAVIAGNERVEMRMPDVSGAKLSHRGRYPAAVGAVHFLDTGAPHAVVPVKSVGRVDVAVLGRALRHNPAFGRAGANVNFVEVRGGRMLVRTYERGVEAETLACGTGITACAVALALEGRVAPPVTAVARSGGVFRLKFKPEAGGASGIRVEGPAKIVFEGDVPC